MFTRVSFRLQREISKKLSMYVLLYYSYFDIEGVTVRNDVASYDSIVFRVPYDRLISIENVTYNNDPCLMEVRRFLYSKRDIPSIL